MIKTENKNKFPEDDGQKYLGTINKPVTYAIMSRDSLVSRRSNRPILVKKIYLSNAISVRTESILNVSVDQSILCTSMHFFLFFSFCPIKWEYA